MANQTRPAGTDAASASGGGRVTAYSRRSARATESSGAIFRFLMRPYDLTHPEACDFMAGNPQEGALPGYVEAIQDALVPDSPSYYRYGPAWRPAVEAVARALAGRLDMDLDPDDVQLTRGAAAGLSAVLQLLVDPGDEVVMMSPPWFFYETMVLAQGGVPVKVPLSEGTFELDLPAIEAAITPRTALVLINTPHNPSGRVYAEEELRGLAGLLETASGRNGRRIYLVSDEAYARILFDGRRMLTPGRFYPATIMLHTYSKTLLAPMQRAGYLAWPPAMPEREELRRAFLGTVGLGALPDAAMQHAMPALEGLVVDLDSLARRRDQLVAGLRDLGYTLDSPEAGFYLFPRTPTADAVAFCDWLAERRVYTLPGEAFERPGRFRLSITATDAMVDRALPVFAEAARAFQGRVSPR